MSGPLVLPEWPTQAVSEHIPLKRLRHPLRDAMMSQAMPRQAGDAQASSGPQNPAEGNGAPLESLARVSENLVTMTMQQHSFEQMSHTMALFMQNVASQQQNPWYKCRISCRHKTV